MAMSPDAGTQQDPSGKAYPTERITVWFDGTRCAHFAECLRGHPDVFLRGRKPWVRPDLGDPEEIAEVIRRCPSGALHYRLTDGPAEEPKVPTSIRRLSAGPVLMRGDLAIRTSAGEIRDIRAAICGCGATKNNPFCDQTCGINKLPE